MNHQTYKHVARCGFSFLELQVALVLLGIALAGLIPLVVMQSKQVKKLEARLDHENTYYLVRTSDVWARKLGAPAEIESEQRKTFTSFDSETAYELNILSLDKQFTSETIQARVHVKKAIKEKELEETPVEVTPPKKGKK